MPPKILQATETEKEYRFVVHLDESKVIPDPAYVKEWAWGKEPPEIAPGILMEQDAYLQMIRDNMKAHIEFELKVLDGRSDLTGFKL